MASRRHCRLGRARQGAAAVEFALTAPVLVLLVFGTIEMGRAMMVQHLLGNAARDGARSAMLEGPTADQVESEVGLFLTESGIHGATVVVTPNPLSLADIGAPVTVQVSVPFSSVSWLPAPWFLGEATLQSTVVMRREVSTDTGGEEE